MFGCLGPDEFGTASVSTFKSKPIPYLIYLPLVGEMMSVYLLISESEKDGKRKREKEREGERE